MPAVPPAQPRAGSNATEQPAKGAGPSALPTLPAAPPRAPLRQPPARAPPRSRRRRPGPRRGTGRGRPRRTLRAPLAPTSCRGGGGRGAEPLRERRPQPGTAPPLTSRRAAASPRTAEGTGPRVPKGPRSAGPRLGDAFFPGFARLSRANTCGLRPPRRAATHRLPQGARPSRRAAPGAGVCWRAGTAVPAKAAEAPCAAGCKSTAGVWAARGRASAKNEVIPNATEGYCKGCREESHQRAEGQPLPSACPPSFRAAPPLLLSASLQCPYHTSLCAFSKACCAHMHFSSCIPISSPVLRPS
ncbi:translation initiation factor IF-2-like [Gallus gallus]|uniref:translation initiation factor IF-2-like n=1 Tax=Gallus gallus TaxID=9031 RepID=UPI001AE71E50|nr:translation initiation factor IF-2-like [Gallus gallus]